MEHLNKLQLATPTTRCNSFVPCFDVNFISFTFLGFYFKLVLDIFRKTGCFENSFLQNSKNEKISDLLQVSDNFRKASKHLTCWEIIILKVLSLSLTLLQLSEPFQSTFKCAKMFWCLLQEKPEPGLLTFFLLEMLILENLRSCLKLYEK